MLTIIDVCRELHIKITVRDAWELGPRVRDAYRTAIGEPPLKALRPKTYGTGSHFFAVYPLEFRPYMVDIIRAFIGVKEAQLDMFDPWRHGDTPDFWGVNR